MNRSLLAFVGFCGLFLTSCMDLETSEQLERIASMNQTVDSVETVFKEHDIDSLSKISLRAYGVENRIKNNYHTDTVNMEIARKMDAFKIMRRSLTPLGRARSIIPASITEEREKLKELKTDIENGDGERKKYAEFVRFEEEKVSQLRILLNEYVDKKEASLKTYDDLYDDLNAFSMSLIK